MNLAYGWAFFNPVRKVYYNLAITGLSVTICFVIGAVEALSLLPREIHGLSRTAGFWGLVSRFNINAAGFVIVGLFVVTWLAALLIWRLARIEERWSLAGREAVPRDQCGHRGDLDDRGDRGAGEQRRVLPTLKLTRRMT